jgi:hypothetical protein
LTGLASKRGAFGRPRRCRLTPAFGRFERDMKRPVIHNRFLSETMHRIFNGIMAAVFSVSIGAWGWKHFGFHSIIGPVFQWLIYLSVPIGILFLFMNPKHHSLVEGVGGENGYDELTERHEE